MGPIRLIRKIVYQLGVFNINKFSNFNEVMPIRIKYEFALSL